VNDVTVSDVHVFPVNITMSLAVATLEIPQWNARSYWILFALAKEKPGAGSVPLQGFVSLRPVGRQSSSYTIYVVPLSECKWEGQVSTAGGQ
jgi:hypothetical protein